MVNMKKSKIIANCWGAVILCLLVSACALNTATSRHKEVSVESDDGSRIAYGVSGQGKTTLVFVHGWLGDHNIWQSQIDYFSKNYRIIWLDLAGHGHSEPGRQNFSIPAFARDVTSVLDTAGGERLILVGHSMGGPIVIEAAELLGEKVVGIVGVDAFYTPLASVPEKVKMRFIKKLKTDYPTALSETVTSMFTRNADPELVALTYKKMLAADQKMGVSSLYECIKWNSRTEPLVLKKFSGKLYNINGAPTGTEKRMHESVVLIPGAGHFVSQVKPDEFNAALERIIEKFEIH